LPDRSQTPIHAADYLEQWAGHYKNCFDVLADRDRWVARCDEAERALGQRDEQLREHRSLIEDRQRWVDRCLAAETALSKSEQLRRADAEETVQVRSLLDEREAETVGLIQELSDLRTSATWRWSQAFLQSQPVQFLFSGLIRSVAERSQTNGALHISHPPESQNGHRVLKPVSPPARQSPDPGDRDVQSRADRMISDHGFLGVPRETFAQAGREQLIALLAEGLSPESKVLEFGCGCLRIASWLVRFLNSDSYYGIEPARQRVNHGLHYLFTPEELDIKRPSFDYNAVFDASVFGTKFDFFLARSIWTHASKPQIEATLDTFVRDAAPHAIFLASYLPAQSPDDDYNGNDWVGTSHESDTPGVIRHSLSWIGVQCHRRNLTCDEIYGIDCDGQSWLRIQRSRVF
jgi:hypothetical protein